MKKRNLRHFLDLNLIDTKIIRRLLDLGHEIKKNKINETLKNKTLAMIFEKPSTRTRVSFEIGMKQLKGDVVILDQNDTQLGRGESIQDTIKVMSEYVDIIMYRGSSEERLNEIVKTSEVPIINGLTNNSHPCQIMADLLTLEEKYKNLNNLIITWIGDGNNVCNSWIHSVNHFDFKLRICTPNDYKPKKKELEKVKNKKNIELYEDPQIAAKDSNVIVTDTWVSMGMKNEDSRLEKFKGFQVNNDLMSLAKENAYFLHCLPAHRGYEVSSEVIDGEKSLVWIEASNRLYVQKAILLWCLFAED